MSTLKRHFSSNRDELLALFEHINIASHPDVKGTCREGFVSLYLKDNLPETIQYGSGQISDGGEILSPQQDIVLQSINSPKMKLYQTLNLYFIEHVLACIEVKSTLNKTHLEKALNSCKTLKEMNRSKFIKVPRESESIALERTPFILFAYNGFQSKTLVKKIAEKYPNRDSRFKFAPDLIVNLKNDFILIKNDNWLINLGSSGRNYTARNGNTYVLKETDCLSYLFQYICLLIDADRKNLYEGEIDINKYL